MLNIQRILGAISLFLLTACGGGGGSSPQTTQPQTRTISGVVADGYLTGAKVCLDTNLNKKCDGGEPATTSGVGGVYTIADVPIAALAKYPIVAEVPAGAVDSERGTVMSGYLLTAPAGKPEFISPLTTMVQSQIETSGQTLTDAVATVKTRLGLTTMSPLADYKPGVAGASAEAVMAAGVAKVIATTIAENKAAIEVAVAGSSTTVTVQQVVDLIVQQVMQNLPAVVLQVQTATNNGANVLAEDKVSGVVSGSGVNVSTADVTVLRQQLTATTTNDATKMKLTIALQGAGASGVKAVQATIALPAGVVLHADAAGKPLAGVLAGAGNAAAGFIDGKYTPAGSTSPAILTLGIITTGSLAAGDIVIINASLAAGATAPAAGAFTLGSSKLVDTSGNIVSGASLDIR